LLVVIPAADALADGDHMTTLRIPHYLTRDRKGFWFRIFVPLHLRPIIGRSVFKKSLRTLDPVTAAERAQALAARYSQTFRVIGIGVMAGDDDELKVGLAALYGGTAKKLEIEGHTPSGQHFRIKTDGSPAENAVAKDMVATMFDSEAYRNAVASINAPVPEIASTGPLIEAAFHTYFQIGDTLGPENRDARQRAARWFVEYAGAGVRTHDVTKAMAVRWLDALQLDKTEIAGKDRHGKPVAKTIPGMTKLTARGYCGHLKMIWRWLIRRGQAETNPWEGIINVKKIEKKQRRKEGNWREPFDEQQLRAIFNPATLQKAGTMHARWGAVLGLYTGARVGEIAQIYLRDFGAEDGVPFVKITDENEGQRVKSDESVRRLPIHPELIRLGFLEYVEERRRTGADRLFDVKLDGAGGVGNAMGKAFGYYIKTHVGLKPKKENAELGMHSFRKSLTQLLKSHERIASPGKRLQFMGRENKQGVKDVNETEDDHYAVEYTVRELVDVNDAIDWAARLALDFDGLRTLLHEQKKLRKQPKPRSAYAERRAVERAAEAKAQQAGSAGKKK